MKQLKKLHTEAKGALALEEYSLLALKDEQEQLKQLLHEVDGALPLTTRRSGLTQARPLTKDGPPTSSSEAAAAVTDDEEEDEEEEEDELDVKTAAELEFKAETAARKLEVLSETVAHCRNAALRSLAARLRQTEEQLALRKETSTPVAAQKSTKW